MCRPVRVRSWGFAIAVVSAAAVNLACWVTAFLLLVGVGRCVPSRRPRDIVDDFWAGWAATLLALGVAHFFVPIDGAAAVCVFLISLCGWLGRRTAFRGDDRFVAGGEAVLSRRRSLVLTSVASMSAALIVAAATSTGPPSYDHDLYHAQAVGWTSEYPVVRGLANLHTRLGFNSSTIPYAALCDATIAGQLPLGAYVGPLFLAVWLDATRGLAATISRGAAATLFARYSALSAVCLVWPIVKVTLPGYSADTFAYFTALAATGCVVRVFDARDAKAADVGRLACCLFAATVSIKLSGGVYGALGFALAAVALVSNGGAGRRELAYGVVYGTALGAVTVGRFVVLTGHLVFPAAATRLDVDHAVPEEVVRYHREVIYTWAVEHSGADFLMRTAWAYSPEWVEFYLRARTNVLAPLLAIAVTCCLRSAGAADQRRFTGLVFTALTGWAAAIYACWLANAPDERFAGAFLTSVAAAVVGLATGQLSPVGRVVLVGVFVIGCGTTVPAVSRWTIRNWPAARFSYELRPVVTDQGLAVNVPVTGDRVGDGPRPATPDLDPQLRAYSLDDPAAGFRIAPSEDVRGD